MQRRVRSFLFLVQWKKRLLLRGSVFYFVFVVCVSLLPPDYIHESSDIKIPYVPDFEHDSRREAFDFLFILVLFRLFCSSWSLILCVSCGFFWLLFLKRMNTLTKYSSTQTSVLPLSPARTPTRITIHPTTALAYVLNSLHVV